MEELLISYPIFGSFYMWLNWHHFSRRPTRLWQLVILWVFWLPLLAAQLIYETYYLTRRITRRVKKWWSKHV